MQINNFKANKELYREFLIKKELSEKTVIKYLRDSERFYTEMNVSIIDFNIVSEYKNKLIRRYKSATVNSYLISLNQYWSWCGRNDLRVSLIKCQRSYFSVYEFSVSEYHEMLDYAKKSGDVKWYLIMRCLGSMGIRVGELKFITYESILHSYAEILFKGKLRTILIPETLRKQLKSYCECCNIEKGFVFLNKKSTAPINSSVVWRNLKRIANACGIDESKVFPHNFRHMFARVYMDAYHNIVDLADILGHSSIETTRIYTKTSKEVQRHRIEQLDL